MPSPTREESSRLESDDDEGREVWWRWNGQSLAEWIEQRSCQNCRFWQYSERSVERQLDIGECRRNAPLSIGTQILAAQLSAYTTFDYWCGDFRRKP